MTLQWQKRTSSLTMPILLFCLITPCAGGRVQHFLNTVRKCLQSVGNTVTRAKYYSTAYNKAPRFSHKRSLALFCHFQGPFYFPPWSTTLQRQPVDTSPWDHHVTWMKAQTKAYLPANEEVVVIPPVLLLGHSRALWSDANRKCTAESKKGVAEAGHHYPCRFEGESLRCTLYTLHSY